MGSPRPRIFEDPPLAPAHLAEQRERLPEHRPLGLGISSGADELAVPVRHAQRARRLHVLEARVKVADRHRGDSSRLEKPCDQSDGLMAQRSDGHEQCDLHAFTSHPAPDPLAGETDQSRRIRAVSVDGVPVLGKRSDLAGPRQLL